VAGPDERERKLLERLPNGVGHGNARPSHRGHGQKSVGIPAYATAISRKEGYIIRVASHIVEALTQSRERLTVGIADLKRIGAAVKNRPRHVIERGGFDKDGIRRSIDRNCGVCKRADRYCLHPIFEPTVQQQFRRLWRGGDHDENGGE
jgi:hypothetical protein